MFLPGQPLVLRPNWVGPGPGTTRGLPVWEHPDGAWQSTCMVSATPLRGPRGHCVLLFRVCKNNINDPKDYDMEDIVTTVESVRKIKLCYCFFPSFE